MTILYEPARQRAHQLAPLLDSSTHTVSDRGELARILAADPTEALVLVGPGVRAEEACDVAARHRVHRPALGVILLRDEIDTAILGCALRAGVREVVAAGDVSAVRAACARSWEVSRQLTARPGATASAQAPAGVVVTVFAPKGGCGKSTLAINMAVALAQTGQYRVCLIDFDLSFGDVGIMLQLVPQRGLANLLAGRTAVDADLLGSLLTPCRPGLDVLLAPIGPTEAEAMGEDVASAVLPAARAAADVVIVDTPSQFTDHVLAALDLSDLHLLIATPEIPSLKNLRLGLDLLDLLKLPAARRLVVLNRADARTGLTSGDVERVIQAPVGGKVPSSPDVPLLINRGVPIVEAKPNHPVSKAIRSLVTGQITPLMGRAASGDAATPAATRPRVGAGASR